MIVTPRSRRATLRRDSRKSTPSLAHYLPATFEKSISSDDEQETATVSSEFPYSAHSDNEQYGITKTSQGGCKIPEGHEPVPVEHAVKVYVRIRPVKANEMQDLCVGTDPSSSTCVVTDKTGNKSSFSFEKVFWSATAVDEEGGKSVTQTDLYQDIGPPLLNNVLDGFNACLLAYGQTGSGKTYTVLGNSETEADWGLATRMSYQLMRQIEERQKSQPNTRWTVRIGFVEVYNEKTFDLLAPRPVIRQVRATAHDEVVIAEQTTMAVNSADDIIHCINRGIHARHTGKTQMNDRSSRSHAIIQFHVKEFHRFSCDSQMIHSKSSKLSLVDLAGSERLRDVSGVQFNQGRHINRSLTALGRVIDTLAHRSTLSREDSSEGHHLNFARSLKPPYRDSKLTHILKDSLGGNSQTIMIATIAPTMTYAEETKSTLLYATRAKQIVNVAHVNESIEARRIRALEAELEILRVAGRQASQHTDEDVNKLQLRIRELEEDAAQRALVEQQKDEALSLLESEKQQKKRLVEDKERLEHEMKIAREEVRAERDRLQQREVLHAEYEEKQKKQTLANDSQHRQLKLQLLGGIMQQQMAEHELSYERAASALILESLHQQGQRIESANCTLNEKQAQCDQLKLAIRELELTSGRSIDALQFTVLSSHEQIARQHIEQEMWTSHNYLTSVHSLLIDNRHDDKADSSRSASALNEYECDNDDVFQTPNSKIRLGSVECMDCSRVPSQGSKKRPKLSDRFDTALKYKTNIIISPRELSSSNIYRPGASSALSVVRKYRSPFTSAPELITDDVLLQLTKRTQGTLQVLNLENCVYVTDEGVRTLVQSSPLLRVIVLRGCSQLSDRSLDLISQSPCKQSLEVVDLTSCRFSFESVMNFSRACKQLLRLVVADTPSICAPRPLSALSALRRSLEVLS